MVFLKYNTLTCLPTTKAITELVYKLEKELFTLRVQKSTNKKIKPHQFSHLKRQIAQIKFKHSEKKRTS